MEWLNYHHLYYFWTVAREGGLAPAGRKLRVSHSSIKAQVNQLEEHIGEKLLERQGRGLVLTETGRIAVKYAETIFGLGQEFLGVVRGNDAAVEQRFRLGATHVVPKLLVKTLTLPLVSEFPDATLSFHEGSREHLLASLANHELDVVLTDTPLPPGTPFKAFNHRVTRSEISFLVRPKLARRLKSPFPQCLDEAPLLMPTPVSTLRRVLEDWFQLHGLRPRVRYEFDDMALLKVFGEEDLGIFPVPTVIEDVAIAQTRTRVLGRAEAAHVSFFAVSPERRITNPMVRLMTETLPSKSH
ncbi:MAG: LysR family transcriptional regulator [Myxococcota bacterium]